MDFTDGELYFGVKFRDGEYHEHNERCVRNADMSNPTVPCPAESALNNDQQLLAPLRVFRDRMLAKSAHGQEYVGKYYEHAAEISTILTSDLQLKKQAAGILISVAPLIAIAADDPTIAFPRKIVSAVEDLLDGLEQQASSALQGSIKKVRKDLGNPSGWASLGVVVN